ncbi:hypothetical protein FRC03_005413 [Tulasnella sp. 419]|nr:hypothetical protein FRC03_005413 [Tulasnella sp. 419]
MAETADKKYWMHLSNYQFKHRLEPVKDLAVIVHNPPYAGQPETWTVTFYYGGHQFGASASKKQVAKDLAAKQVLLHLGIDLDTLRG